MVGSFLAGAIRGLRRGNRQTGAVPSSNDISRARPATVIYVAANQPTLRMEIIGALGRVVAIFTKITPFQIDQNFLIKST
jgi:hypothetical protein